MQAPPLHQAEFSSLVTLVERHEVRGMLLDQFHASQNLQQPNQAAGYTDGTNHTTSTVSTATETFEDAFLLALEAVCP
jgi:hypothetical protein